MGSFKTLTVVSLNDEHDVVISTIFSPAPIHLTEAWTSCSLVHHIPQQHALGFSAKQNWRRCKYSAQGVSEVLKKEVGVTAGVL